MRGCVSAALLGGAIVGGVASPVLAQAAPVAAVTPPAASWPVAAAFVLPAGSQPGRARIAFSERGRALVDWVVASPAPGAARWTGLVQLEADGSLRIAPNGKARLPKVLHRRLAAPPTVEVFGGGMLLGGSYDGQAFKGLGWAHVVDTVGPWYPLTSADVLSASLSANRRGDTVAVWLEQRGRSRRLRAAIRPAARGFGAPITLVRDVDDQSEFGGTVTGAVSSDGRLLVAFAGHPSQVVAAKRRLYAWIGSVKGGFGGRLVVGPQEGSASLSATFTTDGRAVMAWGAQSGGIEAGSPWVVRAATLRRGARAFGRPQTLDPGGVKEWRHSPVLVARGPKGTSTVGWGTAAMIEGAVRVASSDRNGRFGAFEDIAGTGDFTGIDVRSDGAAVASWTAIMGGAGPRLGLSSHTIGAAIRLPGERRFGGPESVGSYGLRTDVPWSPSPAGVPAFDPRTGRPVVPVVVEDASGAPVLELRTRATSLGG